jgi:ankyrin repeat protein
MKRTLLLVSCMAIFLLIHLAAVGETREPKDMQIEELSRKAFRYSSREGRPTLTFIAGYTGKTRDEEWHGEGLAKSSDDKVAVLSSPDMAVAIPETSKILAFLDCPADVTQPESILAIFDRGNMNVPLCFSRLNLVDETSDVNFYYWGGPNSIEARRASDEALYVVVTMSGADGGDFWESLAFLHIDMSCRITVLSKLYSGHHCNGGCEGARMEYRFIGNDIVRVTETCFTAGEKGPEKTVKTTWKNYHLARLLNNPQLRVFPSETEKAAAMLHSGDVNIKDKDGRTPLMWAARDGFPELVKGLLAKGAKVNAEDYKGRTPLIWTIRRCCPEPVRRVTDKGEDVSAMSLYADTPPAGTGNKGCMPILKLLLDRGAHVNTRDKQGQTPLMHLAERGSPEMVQALLEKGADVNAKTKDGFTILMWAAQGGNSNVVRMLLDGGADVNAKDKVGWTALMSAAKRGQTDVIEMLLGKGADVNAKKTEGWTALMSAAKADHLEAVRLLLDRGADINAKTKDGRTALRVARAKGNKPSEELLKARGAEE